MRGLPQPQGIADRQGSAAFAEVGRLAHVLTRSAAKNESSFVRAVPLLVQAKRIIEEYYPIGNDTTQVRERALTSWRYAENGKGLHMEAFRDVVQFVELLAQVFDTPELQTLHAHVAYWFAQSGDEQGRASLLLQLQKAATLEEAQQVYEQLLQIGGDVDYVRYVTGQYFVRALRSGNVPQATGALYEVLRTVQSAGDAVLIAKGGLNGILHQLGIDAVSRWRREVRKNPAAFPAPELRTLPDQWRYFGLPNTLVEISKQPTTLE